MTTSPHMIELREVSHVYTTQAGPLPVLDNLNIAIPENTFCAVVGPSGCGKSTLTRLVSGLMKPRGTGLAAFPTGHLAAPHRRHGVPEPRPAGMAHDPRQRAPAHGDREIPDDQGAGDERARHLLDLVGLTGFEDKRPSELSGGMRQRASLCRSIIHKPDVLILDEPFGALDAFTREDLWCTMHDLREEEPFTCLLITHDLRESVFLADQVVVLSGRPAHTQYVLDVDMPGKRKLDDLYTPKAVEMLAILRHQIQVAQGRAEDASEPLAEHAPPAGAARRPIPGAMQ
jgi:NitT/TauT family transport system ATP-binding protein